MIDSNFRSFFQTILIEPIANFFSRQGMKPNQLTLLAMLLGILASASLIASQKWLAIALLLLSGLFDAADGTLARKTAATSDKGCVFDIVSDRIVEAAMVIGLYLHEPTTRGLPALVLLASFYLCVTTFLLSGIFEKNQSAKSFHYSPGLIERSETFAFFVMVIVWEASFIWAAFLFAALVLFTTLTRFFELVRLSSPAPCPPISQKSLAFPHQATTPTKDQQETL